MDTQNNILSQKNTAERACNDWWNELTLGDKLLLFNKSADEFASVEGAEAAMDEAWCSLSSEERLELYSVIDENSLDKAERD